MGGMKDKVLNTEQIALAFFTPVKSEGIVQDSDFCRICLIVKKFDTEN